MKPKATSKDNRPRVIRGGTWHAGYGYTPRAAGVSDDVPMENYSALGFRLTQTGCRRKGVTPP
jgi:hypothetical protein